MLRVLVAAAVVATLAGIGPDAGGTTPSTGGKRLKIGLVAGSEGDPFAPQAVAGLRRAVRELGVTAEVRSPTPREGSVASFTAFAAQRYDLVLGTPLNSAGLVRVARRFPAVRFATVDLSRSRHRNPPANLSGLVFARQEAGYLAGYLAGLVERRRPGRDAVSAVGGERQPGVDTWVAGYRAGARRAAAGIGFFYAYSHSYTAEEPCAAVASNQIAKGSGVIFNVSGHCGLGALSTAAKKRVWGVGVDVDQSSLGLHILTSAVHHLDVGVFRAIQALKDGRYRNGVDLEFGLREGGVGLGRISRRVPRSLVARVERVRRQIVSGKIVVPATLG
jgi:basic membrane protein A